MECGNNLSSRTVARQVLSAQMSLTSVFGMSTGGSSSLSSPQWLYNCISTDNILNFSPLKTDNRIELFKISLSKVYGDEFFVYAKVS